MTKRGYFGDGFAVKFGGDVLVGAHEGFRPGPHDLGQGLDVRSPFQGLGYEVVAEVVRPDAAGDTGAFEGVFPGMPDAFYRFPPVMDDGAFLVILVIPFFQETQEVLVDRDHAFLRAALVGRHDQDGLPIPENGVPGKAQELHGTGPEAQVIGKEHGPDQMRRSVFQDGFCFFFRGREDHGVIGCRRPVRVDRVEGNQRRIAGRGPVEDGLDVGEFPADGGVLDRFSAFHHVPVQVPGRKIQGFPVAELREDGRTQPDDEHLEGIGVKILGRHVGLCKLPQGGSVAPARRPS